MLVTVRHLLESARRGHRIAPSVQRALQQAPRNPLAVRGPGPRARLTPGRFPNHRPNCGLFCIYRDPAHAQITEDRELVSAAVRGPSAFANLPREARSRHAFRTDTALSGQAFRRCRCGKTTRKSLRLRPTPLSAAGARRYHDCSVDGPVQLRAAIKKFPLHRRWASG